jgi:hypothetical protein
VNPAPDRPGLLRPDPVPRLFSAAALLVSIAALVMAMSGLSAGQGRPAAGKTEAGGKKTAATPAPAKTSTKPEPHGVLYLNAKGKIPLSVLPTVPAAKNASKIGGATKQKLSDACAVSSAIDMGTWCVEGTTYKIPASDVGKNNWVYATQKCVEEGGWLPSAAELIGAAPKIALKSTLDDDPATSATSEFPEVRNGIKDEREMTSDLFTTTAGGAAAGSEGVSAGARGATATGEPDPLPAPANPLPSSLDYVTVFDNHNAGGFAGGQPVSEPQNFRCAYSKGYQGKPRDTSSRS